MFRLLHNLLCYNYLFRNVMPGNEIVGSTNDKTSTPPRGLRPLLHVITCVHQSPVYANAIPVWLLHFISQRRHLKSLWGTQCHAYKRPWGVWGRAPCPTQVQCPSSSNVTKLTTMSEASSCMRRRNITNHGVHRRLMRPLILCPTCRRDYV